MSPLPSLSRHLHGWPLSLPSPSWHATLPPPPRHSTCFFSGSSSYSLQGRRLRPNDARFPRLTSEPSTLLSLNLLPRETQLLFHQLNYHFSDFCLKHQPDISKCFLRIPVGFSAMNSNSTSSDENLSHSGPGPREFSLHASISTFITHVPRMV